ncbi:MAG: HD domain-containing protein [Agriterribacter sp.]
MLKNIFIELAGNYAAQNEVVHSLWNEIEKQHTQSKRFYHTLTHLENLLTQLQPVRDQVDNWTSIVFATCYHDIVYNVLKKNNEEKSAELARKRLTQLQVPEPVIQCTVGLILATESHRLHQQNDINLFTDADLSVLGSDWNTYELYSRQIRKEYGIYPDIVYKPGRRKVLLYFLELNNIYKTAFFAGRYERQARLNLRRELEEL